MKAAQRLDDAANNEDSEDISESTAESMVAAIFYGLAKDMLDDLAGGMKKKNQKFDQKTQKVFDDSATAAKNGKPESEKKLKSYIKW